MSEGVIALVPARSGSKGVPDKNIRLLGGRSLIEWSVAAALRASSVDRVIVSTDDADIAAVAAFLTAGLFEYNFGDSEVVMMVYFLMALPFVSATEGGASKQRRRARCPPYLR